MSWFKSNRDLLDITLKPLRSVDGYKLKIFGSSIRVTDPHDIDLLLVINEGATEDQVSKIKLIVSLLKKKNLNGIPVNVLMLHQCEIIHPVNVISNILSKAIEIY